MTWKASSALPPWATGSVSGPITLWNSITEPGQPWVINSGRAFSLGDRLWMKWMSSPSICVLNWPKPFSIASQRRQSYVLRQWSTSERTCSSGAPCDQSATGSFSGQRTASRRRARSSSCAWSIDRLKGSMVEVMVFPKSGRFRGASGMGYRRSVKHARSKAPRHSRP